MDSDQNPQGADLIPSKPCADAKRLRCSAMPSDHVSKVLDEDNTSSWSAPVHPLDDENLLQEILLRLPPKPSSLPRASLVCTRWRTIISDPQFLGRFRKHHRKPPLLGFFVGKPLTGNPVFTPVLKPPDCIPSTRFSVPESCHSDNSWLFNGCRHGLAPLVSQLHREIVVWDPLTGQHHRVTFPPGLDYKQLDYFQATVLCADAEDGHVHGDCFLSPFKLVFIGAGYKMACGSLYDSVSGVWGNIVSVAITQRIPMQRPHILVRNALCLLIFGGDVLAFDFERQRLDVIEKPADAPFANSRSVQVLRTEDGGLGLAALSELTIKLWERRLNCDGVVGWVLLKTILLEGLLPRGVQTDNQLVLFVGYDEDTNMILLSTMIGYFTLQLDSMLVSDIMKRKTICFNTLYPYRNFYAAARAPSGNGWIWNW